MSQFKSSGDIEGFAHDAGQSYRNAISLNREDFQLRALVVGKDWKGFAEQDV